MQSIIKKKKNRLKNNNIQTQVSRIAVDVRRRQVPTLYNNHGMKTLKKQPENSPETGISGIFYGHELLCWTQGAYCVLVMRTWHGHLVARIARFAVRDFHV